MTLYGILKFVHILTVVFMAAPLYSLIIVNERSLFSSQMIYNVDRYMETIIARNALRCFVFQVTALLSGVGLVWQAGWGWNSVLWAKLALLLVLMGLLALVHFGIQPKINGLLEQVRGDPVPPEVALQIKPLRLRRKRLAATCLFLVITSVLLGVQVFSGFPLAANLLLLSVAGWFSWRAFNKPVRLGWW